MTRVTPGCRSRCPVAFGLDIFGDQWTLLVIRDLVFGGDGTFQSFAQSPEGIATNVLAERLARLEAAGIVGRLVDEQDRRRGRYYLTEKGVDLYPVLLEMIRWGGKHQPDSPATPALVARLAGEQEQTMKRLRDTARKAGRATPARGARSKK